jgi:hypothetical protein
MVSAIRNGLSRQRLSTKTARSFNPASRNLNCGRTPYIFTDVAAPSLCNKHPTPRSLHAYIKAFSEGAKPIS